MAKKKKKGNNNGNWGYLMEQLSLGGFERLPHGTRCKVRTAWFFILIFAVSMLIFEVIKITETYMAEPTLSDISTITPTIFPDIAYCPYVWIDPIRAERAGMDHDVYRYIQSLSTWAVVAQTDFFDLVYGGMDPKTFLFTQQAEIARLRAKFNTFLTRNNISRFTQLIDVIAFAPEDVMTIIKHPMIPQNLSLERTDGVTRICYQINDATTYTEGQMAYHLQVMYIHDLNTTAKASAETPDILSIGNDMGIRPSSPVVITTEDDQLVTLTTTEFSRVSTKKRPCAWWTLRDRDRCSSNCINKEFCSEIANCTYFVPWDDEIGKLCTYYSMKNCFFMIKMNPEKQLKTFGSCAYRCPKPCRTWFYQSMLTPTRRKGNRTYSVVRVKYGDPSNTIRVDEHLRESWYSVLSSIGGTLSLWLGASLLSLIHLLTAVLSIACKSVRKTTDPSSATGDTDESTTNDPGIEH